MRGTRGRLRALALLSAGAGTLLLGALPASAAAGISITTASDGSAVSASQPVTADDVLQIHGQIDPRTKTTDLVVTAPAGDSHTVAEATASFTSGASLDFDLTTSCLTYDARRAPCSGRSPAPNGTWTAQLTGGATATSQFVLRIPPAAPTGVTATASGSGAVVSWQLGAEPDLRSYDVLDGSGQQLVGGLSPSNVCDASGGCSTTIAKTSAQSFMVRAHRATCPSCSDTVASAPSSAASISSGSSAAPVPSQSGDPSAGGSTQPGSSSGTAQGGSPAPSTSPGAQPSGGKPGAAGVSAPGRRAAASGAAGRLLQQFLPAPTALQAPTVPASILAPLADGTYKPKLAYGQQTVGEDVLVPDGSTPRIAAHSTGVLSGLMDSGRVWESVAEGVLLLLVCAHLMAWLARTRPE
ncbi:MAG TPA: hypothetical protein VFJ21_00570 [Mycobacteriales bacterium]|nr:hypothetical protein [Mycobacteriales bacterium]